VAGQAEKADYSSHIIRKNRMKKSRPLNLKHLRYFAEVARRGSVTSAATALFVAPQTVSTQVLELEQSVGQPLFERVGRRLVLTSAGETALDYANAIFALGDELATVLRGGGRPRSITLRVGVTDSVPKLMTVAVLQPVIEAHRDELELECREGPYARLLGELASGDLDMMLADAAVPANLSRTIQARALSESGMSFLAHRPLAARLARGFPASLDSAPFIAGSEHSALPDQALAAWFARQDVRPRMVGHIDDSALAKGFAQRGLGVVAVPSSIEAEVARQYGLGVVGRTGEVRQAIFLLRARGRRAHPLVAEIEAGQRTLRASTH
jgi:LysR family transcriptional activator of nhaA